jgi:hypothetical protein
LGTSLTSDTGVHFRHIRSFVTVDAVSHDRRFSVNLYAGCHLPHRASEIPRRGPSA